jgi:hypothetical protein
VGYFLSQCPLRPPVTLSLTQQAITYSMRFDDGFRLQTPGKITTLHINLGIAEPEHGGLKVTLMRNGSLLVLVPSYGFMENVGISLLRWRTTRMPQKHAEDLGTTYSSHYNRCPRRMSNDWFAVPSRGDLGACGGARRFKRFESADLCH